MKALLSAVIFSLITTISLAQNISGKWFGKVTQGPGAYSELYELTLDLRQTKRDNISGESHAFISDVLDARIGLWGTIKDSIRLQEDVRQIRQERLPDDYILCIKKLILSYHKHGSIEYLIGRWSGISKLDSSDCIPGKVLLTRSKHDLDQFFSDGGFNNPLPVTAIVVPPLREFTRTFNSTSIRKVTEIKVNHKSLQIQLSDYLNVDNDTVSIYLNRNILAKNIWISKRPVKIDFNLENIKELNEILLFAENLGKIPPNTSLMVIIDGNRKHQIKIESDKKKTAAIYLHYMPETPK